MRNINRAYIVIIIIAALLAGCQDSGRTYKIGVAQCSKGPWREKVNQEMLAAQHLYENDVEVDIVNSFDDPEMQARQIDSLAGTDIDLMVVAPYEDIKPINDAIARVLRRMWRDGKLTINKINTMNILWLLILMPIGLLLNKWTRSGHK